MISSAGKSGLELRGFATRRHAPRPPGRFASLRAGSFVGFAPLREDDDVVPVGRARSIE
jgi:hypothetical protein